LSKTLFSWFSAKKSDPVIELAKEHFALTKEVIGNLKSMIEEDIKGNTEERARMRISQLLLMLSRNILQ
jgi:hypothetical protein